MRTFIERRASFCANSNQIMDDDVGGIEGEEQPSAPSSEQILRALAVNGGVSNSMISGAVS